jgi:endonuclease G
MMASWLREGAALTEAIGRLTLTKNVSIEFVSRRGHSEKKELPAGHPVGTCFLVAPKYAITAKHVIASLSNQTSIEAAFPSTQANRFHFFKLNGSPILIDPDIALLPLTPTEGALLPATFVSLCSALDQDLRLHALTDRDAATIHFPGNSNGIQRFSYKNSQFVAQTNDCYWYTCDTDSGSSGAPVFNSSWGLVAVHWGTDGRANRGYRTDLVVSRLVGHLKSLPDGVQILRDLGIQQ